MWTFNSSAPATPLPDDPLVSANVAAALHMLSRQAESNRMSFSRKRSSRSKSRSRRGASQPLPMPLTEPSTSTALVPYQPSLPAREDPQQFAERMSKLERDLNVPKEQRRMEREVKRKYNSLVEKAESEERASREMMERALQDVDAVTRHRARAIQFRSEAAALYPDDQRVQHQANMFNSYLLSQQPAMPLPPMLPVTSPPSSPVPFVSTHSSTRQSTSTVTASPRRPLSSYLTRAASTPPLSIWRAQPKTSTPASGKASTYMGEVWQGWPKRPASPIHPPSDAEMESDPPRPLPTEAPKASSLAPPKHTAAVKDQAVQKANRLLECKPRKFKKTLYELFYATQEGLTVRTEAPLQRTLESREPETEAGRHNYLQLLRETFPDNPTYEYLVPRDRSVLARMQPREALSYACWLLQQTPQLIPSHNRARVIAALAHMMSVDVTTLDHNVPK
jgi:hypothetical protein